VKTQHLCGHTPFNPTICFQWAWEWGYQLCSSQSSSNLSNILCLGCI